jgi:hypothetical protein
MLATLVPRTAREGRCAWLEIPTPPTGSVTMLGSKPAISGRALATRRLHRRQ